MKVCVSFKLLSTGRKCRMPIDKVNNITFLIIRNCNPPFNLSMLNKGITTLSLKKNTLLWSWVYVDSYWLKNWWKQYLPSMKNWPQCIYWHQLLVIICSSESFIKWSIIFTKLMVPGNFSSAGIAQIVPICPNSKTFLSCHLHPLYNFFRQYLW